MGLLLSVLVVCVGVLEVIACVRHFQDGYLPLWTPHCAVTSGIAITHDRWRKLPSFDYAKNDDEKHFEDLTGAKNGAVTLGLQDDSVKRVENFGKTFHCAASLQEEQSVFSEIHLQESETTFVAQKISDSLASANEPEDKNINFTSDLPKQTVIDVFQSDIYNNNLVQTEHNLEADITTFHAQDSTLRSDQDFQIQFEAPAKKAQLIQPSPEDIPDDSLKRAEEHEDNENHETTVVGNIHHEETTHVTKANSSESDSRLEHQTSSSDADLIWSEEIETQPQTIDSDIKREETHEELIETLKKTPSPVRISPPSSTPPLTPKKSKADISWPTFFPGAPVIKRPSVSFATPEALLAGEDTEPRPRNDEEERPATPPPIIKRSNENTPVQSDLESRSVSSESLDEDVDQEEEDNEEENVFSGIREKSPTSIISGNDFSKKELELQRRKSYKLKRFNSAVETVSRDEQAEDRSFSEDKKGVSHAVKSKEPKRRFKKPVKATSFEDAMLRDIRDTEVVDGGTTLKLGKEVKFLDEPTVVAEEEENFLEQEEIKTKTDEGLKVSFGQVESEPEKYVVQEEKQLEKHDFTKQKDIVASEQKIFDEPEDIQVCHDEGSNAENRTPMIKSVDEEVNEIMEKTLNKALETESGGHRNKTDGIQQVIGVNTGMQDVQVHSEIAEVKSSEGLPTKLDSKQGEVKKDDIPAASKEVQIMDNSETHSRSTQAKTSVESTTKYDSKQSEDRLEDNQVSKKEEEEEVEEWTEGEVILDNKEEPSKIMEIDRNDDMPTTLDRKQGQTKVVTEEEGMEEEEEEVVEEEGDEEEIEEEEQVMMVDNSKVHSKAMEVIRSNDISTKLDTTQDEENGTVVAEEEEEEVEEEIEEQKMVVDNSKALTKTTEVNRRNELSTKLDTRQDKDKSVPEEAAEEEEEEEMEEEEEIVEEEEEVEEQEEEEVVVMDNSEVHSKAMEIKRSGEIATKLNEDVEKTAKDTSNVHSKPAETECVGTTTKILAKQGEVEDEGLTKETMKQSNEGQQQRQSSTGVRFAEPEKTTKALEGDHEEEEEDTSSYTYSDSTQQKTPPKEAFWLIFSGEYTKAMSKDWHSGHFCCWQCDESLTGQRYVLRDDHPYCIKCYESVFANTCEECSKIIGIDSKDLSYKDKHWHEACFLCNKCRVSLVDKQFGSKADKIYCGNCYDSQFASRCDGCGEIFRAGTKKMEYKTRQWHEKCFCCCVCKTPIGTKSFIPREQEIYCATCYEEKFATRCVKCNKIITSGGVTYKNEPWHRECFTCTHCNTSLAGQRFTSRDEKPYCADCFGELFAKRCTSCSRPITGIGGTRFISFEDRHWHNDCFICASCKTSLVGRGFITDGDDIICPECAKQKLM